MTSTLDAPTPTRDPLLSISNGMVRLFKEALGRGPRRARTSYVGADAIVVILEQTLTATERSLVALGDYRGIHGLRLSIEAGIEPRARALVEEVVGRRAIAFATAVDPRHDIAAAFFTLEPRPQTADERLPPAGG